MMIPYYILENGLPKKTDMTTWSKWIESHPNRDVKRTMIPETKTKIELITVFFPLPEVDFEVSPIGDLPREFLWFYGTLVKGGPMNRHEEKYRTREEAEDGHERVLAMVKSVLAGAELPECCR